jgi:hypothetical protein
MATVKQTPYERTQVPIGVTKNQIEEMLVKAGALAIQWTTTPNAIMGKECPILQFAIETVLKGASQKYVIKLQPPLLEKESGRGYNKTHVPNMNASMRLLHWYVKSKLEAIEYGLEDFVEAFMPKILILLPDGTTSTVSDALKSRPQIFSQVFMIPESD